MFKRILVVSALCVSLTAFAQNKGQMGGNTEGMNHEISAAGSGIAFGGGQAFRATANLGYHHLLPNVLDKNVQASINLDTTLTDAQKNFALLVGPTLNYMRGEGLDNSMFLQVLVGISVAHTSIGTISDTTTDFAYQIGVGKRFAINRFVSWKPSANLGKNGSFSPTQTSFNIIPLQFSFFWD